MNSRKEPLEKEQAAYQSKLLLQELMDDNKKYLAFLKRYWNIEANKRASDAGILPVFEQQNRPLMHSFDTIQDQIRYFLNGDNTLITNLTEEDYLKLNSVFRNNTQCKKLMDDAIARIIKNELDSLHDKINDVCLHQNPQKTSTTTLSEKKPITRSSSLDHFETVRAVRAYQASPIEKKDISSAIKDLTSLIIQITMVTTASKGKAFNSILDKIGHAKSEDDVLAIFKNTLWIAFQRQKYGIFHPCRTTTSGEKLIEILNKNLLALREFLFEKNILSDKKTGQEIKYSDLTCLLTGNGNPTQNHTIFHGKHHQEAHYEIATESPLSYDDKRRKVVLAARVPRLR